MTDLEWAEMETRLEWRQDVTAACDTAIALRDRLDQAITELLRARERAMELLSDTNTACDIAGRLVRLGP